EDIESEIAEQRAALKGVKHQLRIEKAVLAFAKADLAEAQQLVRAGDLSGFSETEVSEIGRRSKQLRFLQERYAAENRQESVSATQSLRNASFARSLENGAATARTEPA
ncbi:MAG: hypothetical protein L0312_14350, partial [Acidobacteria bacterium]|nr:hypothetical protein [Acidobacteriota bacterium]